MRAGNLFHRINFFEKQITRDDYGASEDTWDFNTPTISTRGEIRFTGGSKTLSNEEKFYSKNIELTVRFRSAIVETMKIQIDGTTDIYSITFIEPIGRNVSLRMTIEKDSESIILPAIDPPTLFTATQDLITLTTINLAWVNNGNNDAIAIERSEEGNIWKEIYRTAISTESYSDEDLTAENYYYRIRHFVAGNNSSYTSVEKITI